MLFVQRDVYGWMQGVLHVMLVDENGTVDPAGTYVYVEQMELSHGVKSPQVIHALIQQVAQTFPTARWGYWERRDRPRQHLRIYSRTQLLGKGAMTDATV